MLSFTNLALRRGVNLLFEQVTFTVHPGNSVGLIGANGAGKTSLFKLITGELEADQGGVDFPAKLRIAHMVQEIPRTETPAALYVEQGDTELISIRAQIDQVEREQRFSELAELHERLDSIDGYSARARAEQLMVGLGFTSNDFETPLSDFSGGWRIRLNLARTLMCPSDLMLLDEPTNHLDLDAVLWLSNWIKQYTGALLLVSHDREFLDECVGNIAYLHNQTIELFTGNYSQFEAIKSARLAEQQSGYAKQQREIKHIQDYIRRFRAQATKARQAQSRIKALERMELISAAHIDSPFHFQIPEAEKTSDPLLTIESADLGYGFSSEADNDALPADLIPVLKNVRMSLHPGDRFGLLGHNGAGKSTLIKSLSGELSLLNGQRTAGANLRLGYFSQHQVDDLNLSQSAFQHIQLLDKARPEQAIRTFLGSFNFQGDKVKERVSTFSGGEKARLALAILAFRKPNLLLMDEPTNHLDIDMRQALTMALQSFAGAILVISHDRHLLANTVNQFLLVDNGAVAFFDGDLDDYRARVLGSGKIKTQAPRKQNKERDSSTSAPAVTSKPLDHRQSRRLRTKIATLEKRMNRLQGKLVDVEACLALPASYAADQDTSLQGLIRDQLTLRDQIEQLEDEWLVLNTELESGPQTS